MNSDPTRPRLGLGYKQDAPDPRDHVYGKTGAALGPSILRDADVTSYILGIKNQAGTSSCFGQAVSACLETYYGVRGNPVKVSALWIYTCAREAEKPGYRGPLDDGGAFPRIGIEAIKARGLLQEKSMPFSEAAVDVRPSPQQAVLAFDAKGLVYYQIEALGEDRCEQVADALRRGYGVCFGMDVSSAYQRNEGDPVDEMGRSIGGHMQAIVKVDDEYVYVQNSWGTEWAERGIVRFTRRFFGEAFITSLLVIREIPNAAS